MWGANKICIVLKYIYVGHGLMLHGFTDLMNVTEEDKIHRPNVLSGTFIRGDPQRCNKRSFYMITK